MLWASVTKKCHRLSLFDPGGESWRKTQLFSSSQCEPDSRGVLGREKIDDTLFHEVQQLQSQLTHDTMNPRNLPLLDQLLGNFYINLMLVEEIF